MSARRISRQPDKPASISVVIPSWNGLEYLKMVLPSLRKQTVKGFETIVVDNGSTDGSVGYIRKHHPGVTVIALNRNIGFAAGVNRGLAATEAEFVALINNDVELDRNWLQAMVTELQQYPKTGSATSCMLHFDRRTVVDNVGLGYSWFGLPRTLGEGEPVRDHREPRAVFAACGGGGMYRHAALKDVGLLDEDFFAYFEDLDWGFRAQLAGWACRYVPTAKLYHVNGGTTKRMSGFSQRLWARNSRFVIIKNYPLGVLVWHAPGLVLAELKMLLGAFNDGWLGTYFHSLGAYLWRLPRMLRRRWRIQRRRQVSLRYLNTVISPRFGTSGERPE